MAKYEMQAVCLALDDTNHLCMCGVGKSPVAGADLYDPAGNTTACTPDQVERDAIDAIKRQ